MNNVIEQAMAGGSRDRVIWLDTFIPIKELMTMFKCTSVYLTLFDESTPTSVSHANLYMQDCTILFFAFPWDFDL